MHPVRRGGVSRIVLAVIFTVAGVLHFVIPESYMRIMPPWLPLHRELVLVSGAAEIAGGLGLLVPWTRRAAGVGLILLLLAGCAALLVLGARSPLAAQAPTTTVMVLGTYHFGNPGLDVVKNEVADVMAPAPQAEMERIVAALARFRPTKIVIEAHTSEAARWDSLYRAYRAGTHALARDEREQLGLRLAARMAHARVYPVDHAGDFPFGELMRYAQTHDTAAARMIQSRTAAIGVEENRRQRELTITGNLRARNDPRQLAADHALYLSLNAVGAGDGYAGANLLSKWYERNLRIFANLQRIAEPGDRILVVYGSGHAPIFRELIRSTSGMALAEAGDFLPAR